MKKLLISTTILICFLIFTSITIVKQQVYAGKEDDDDNNENDKDKKFDPKKATYKTWEGKILNHDEMTERNQKCIEMERKGFLPSNVDCVSFPLTQVGESIIVDYIVQMAMKGYYEPNN